MSTAFTHNPSGGKKPSNIKKSDSSNNELVKISFRGIMLTNATENAILEYILKNLPKQQKPYYIVTPNPEMILYADSHPKFKTILNNAKIALTDGMQLFRAAAFVGKPVKERVIGTDFLENLCEKVANKTVAVGFLGGGPKIAEKTAECLKKKYPNLKVTLAEEEWDEKANHKPVDILFVAFGFPKQEEWMAEHVGKVPVKVMIGVGGAFDQIVHPSLRPPAAIHIVGLGWLYRFLREPWRIKRQAKLVRFGTLVLDEWRHKGN